MPFVVPARRLVATLAALLLLGSGLVAPAAPAFAAASLAAGVEAPDRVLLGEPATVGRLVCIGLIVSGIVGLKLVS